MILRTVSHIGRADARTDSIPPAGGRIQSLIETDAARPLPSRVLFANDRPLEVEIGCGKGRFLIARAVDHPEVDFLGIDVVWKWMKFAVERTNKRGLPNVKFIKRDAREVVTKRVGAETVSVFHIYFPDPWPKRRHHKRRIVRPEFLRVLHDRLAPGGRIELATDHGEYCLAMRAAVVRCGISWADVREATNQRLFDPDFRTNYELKYERGGRTIRYLELVKKDLSQP